MAKFNKLDVPHQWKDEFTKYPHGYTIFEALCKWVKQVDNMVDNINNWNTYLDNFVESFEFELQEEVQSTIERWQSEGLLDDIIGSVLTTELDNVKEAVDTLTADNSNIKDRISILRNNIKMYGVKGDGITDDTDQIQSALSDGGSFYFPDGDYVLTDTISINNSVDIEFSDNAVIRYRGEGSAFYFSGEFLPNVALSSNADKGSMAIQATNTVGISSGDWIYITSDEVASSNAREYDTKREYAQVTSVVGNTINLSKPLFFTHTVANNASFRKCNFLSDVKISGGTLICESEAPATNGYDFRMCKGFRITRTTVKGFDYGCITSYNCVGGIVDGNHVEIDHSDELQYGIVALAGYLINITNNTVNCARSAIDLSRVTMDSVVSNNLIHRGRVGGHTTFNCSFVGNKISNGFIMNRGIDSTIAKNAVVNYSASCLQNHEAGLDGSAHISDNYFVGVFSALIVGYGTVFTGNVIRAYDHTGYLLRIKNVFANSKGLQIINNNIEYIGSNRPSVAIDFHTLSNFVTDVIIKGNTIINAGVGIDVRPAGDKVESTNAIVCDNIIRVAEKGIMFRLTSNVSITGNVIDGITTMSIGIEKYYSTTNRNGLVIAMNIIKNATTGIDSTNGSGKYLNSVVANNSYVNVTTPEKITNFES